jgi:hypothetical protein
MPYWSILLFIFLYVIYSRMPTYHLLEGGQLTAPTDLDLVDAWRLAAQEWVPSVSNEDFMAGVALRAHVQQGAFVRTCHVFFFITDLMEHGLIIPVS